MATNRDDTHRAVRLPVGFQSFENVESKVDSLTANMQRRSFPGAHGALIVRVLRLLQLNHGSILNTHSWNRHSESGSPAARVTELAPELGDVVIFYVSASRGLRVTALRRG